jgi:uncharacterized phage-associated protein
MIRFNLNKEKAIASILYIASKLKNNGIEPDLHKIFKILYFAERKHLATYARPITGDNYIAMDNGPVPSSIYDILKYSQAKDSFQLLGFYIEPKQQPDLDEFSDSDLKFIDESINKNQHLSFISLTKKSHGYAWNNVGKNGNMDYCDIAEEEGATSGVCDLIKLNSENDLFVESLQA